MVCQLCGASFSPSRFNPRQKFCSRRCREKARREYKRAYDRAWRRRNLGYMKRYLSDYRA